MIKKSGTKPKVNPNTKLNALLEIGLEEVPSRFVPAMLDDMKEKAKKELEAARLTYIKLETLGTPRRLVLYIEGLPQKQEDLSKEVRGPQKAAAYDPAGKPTKAAEGFAAGQGVAASDLIVKKVGDKEFVFAAVTEKGVHTDEFMEKFFPLLIKSLYLPISMRWGSSDFKFIRPLHWIFAACGDKVANFDINGIKSGSKTSGHRYFGGKSVAVNITKGVDLEEFKKILLKERVILDQTERKEKIRQLVNASAKKINGEAMMEEDLLNEVTYLVEWPYPVTGSFKKEFLSLPKDVLVTSMKKNQKFFAVVDSSEKLMPAFVNITNGIDAKDEKNVREGNEKVLTARLNDAKFFFDEDRKKFLADLNPGLQRVSFIDKLGNMYEKVERVTALAVWIAHELKLPDMKKENIKIVANLSKADLLTHMVYEFPTLQGIMGREYSLLESRPADIAKGIPADIAKGIFEHYLPRNAGDILPSSVEGAVVGIADRLDTLVGCFAINLIPTGSEDPFGLRRSAQGIVSILSEMKFDLSLDEAVERSYKLYDTLFLSEVFSSGKVSCREVQKVIPDVLSFIAARARGNMIEEGIRYDIADAALANFEDVLDARKKAAAISKVFSDAWFKGIVMTADRVKRLAVNAARGNVIEADLVSGEEKALFATYLEVNNEVAQLVSKGDHVAAIKALSKMTSPVETFFEKVMVMDKDERLKANRLALLKTIERMYLELADFSKIVL